MSTSSTLFEQGLEIMLFGMGTVIAFLTLLVIAMVLMSRALERLYPPAQPQALSGDDAAAPGRGAPSGEVLAVISAAVHRHRQQRGIMHDEETSNG